MHSLLFNPKPQEFESLTSYICRVAEENLVSSHELWRFFLNTNAKYPQSDISSFLDNFPFTSIDLRKFENFLQFSIGTLDSLTFLPVYSKLGVKCIPKSKVLSGLLDKKRRFCPLCLSEKRSYKIYWQVREINCCDVHGIKLLGECWACHREIPMIPNQGLNGFCPFCQSSLVGANCIPYLFDHHEARILKDWMYLLNSNVQGIRALEGLTIQQSIAIQILYVLAKSPVFLEEEKRSIVPTILQTARNSKVQLTYLHLDTILSILRKANVLIDSFANITVPTQFIAHILNEKIRLVDRYACLSPWCKGHSKSGTLERTSTSTKVRIDGSKYNYYMYCTECGLEFCLRVNEHNLTERGYFIDFAFKIVRPLLAEEPTLKQLACKLASSEDKIRRAIIFLAANKIIENRNLPVTIPQRHNSEITKRIIDEIGKGTPAKKIREKLNLGYNEFLCYWLLSKVRVCYLRSIIPTGSRSSNIERKQSLDYAIGSLKEAGISITIKRVSDFLNICPETLRLWGLLPQINEAKKEQLLYKKTLEKKILMDRAVSIIEDFSSKDSNITVEDIYKVLGYGRTGVCQVSCRLTPKLYIS
ncbi:TniQ family protein [Desulfosporosinus shakirovi]|uniref:TniQ family protein n=1 Tax=Desulfosporosinus shakirovi TaxID=2885154 RepID=UPI001E388566|nr:TniQ family protein [Desulfosporosinus sp. SRJS8]MCB8818144.1 TniQ family protein [Desulfosporosinus sp. SRJS8]